MFILYPIPLSLVAWLKIFLLAAALVTLAACSSSTSDLRGQTAKRIIFHNVSLIARSASPVVEGAHVVVESGRITAIGNGKARLEPGDLVIDADERFMSPGLIDMHVHVFDPSDLLLMLAHGITTARHMSGEPKLLHFRERVEAGELPGTSLVVASPAINQRSRYASDLLNRFVEGPEHWTCSAASSYGAMGRDGARTTSC